MAARRKRTRQRRQRGRFGFLYKLLSVLIIFAAVLIGCVAFFRVNDVVVSGNDRYSAQEIIAASGVELGDNLLLINKPQTVSAITEQLPYVKTVAVVRRLPDTLEIRLTETKAAAALREGDNWWLVDDRGKLVEVGASALAVSFPKVDGLTPVTPALGAKLTAALEEQVKLEGLKGLLSALTDRGMMGGVKSFIDLTATSSIYFDYGDELTVILPMSCDFPRKTFALQQVLKTFEAQGERVTGTLDLTYSDGTAHLLTDRWLPGQAHTAAQPGEGAELESDPALAPAG